MKTDKEIKDLLKSKIDFRKVARKLRELQIDCGDRASEVLYAECENDPTMHWSPHLHTITSTDEEWNDQCDIWDNIYHDLLGDALKKVRLVIVEDK